MTDSATTRPATAGMGLIVILGMLAAFAPMATDMYLPGFHLMEAHFSVPEGGIEITLSVFFLGLAVGQALYGPLIDRFGRRIPLLCGVTLYVVATLLCLTAQDITTFTALRFLQAIGGSAGMIIGRAIVRDLYDPQESARALSLLMVTMTLAPILAPIVGGFVIAHSGWRAVFGVMMVFGLLCLALVWARIPETLPREERRSERLSGILSVWVSLMSDRRFAIPALAGGAAQACMFAFITGSPFVFVQLYGADAQSYGLLFAAIACALIVAAQINRVALRRFTPRQIMTVALVCNLAGGIATTLSVQADSLVALMVPLWLTIGSLGFIGANAMAIAMANSGHHAGSGSSLVGVLQFGSAFLVSGLVAAAQNGTAYPMTLALVCCGTFGTVIWFLFHVRD